MQRNYALDIAKIVSMFLVAWSHFVSAGSYEINKIYGVIHEKNALPLIPVETHSLWSVESFFYNMFQIQFSTVGVITFFIISGMFIPVMQEKYIKDGNSNFCLFRHCFNRIFPTLFITVLLITAIEKYLQGINFSLWQILATSTGVPTLFNVAPVTGVIWFLTVLEVMWLISCLVPKYTLQNVLVLYIICLFFTILPHISKSKFEVDIRNIAYNTRMIGIILIGVVWQITKNLHKIDRCLYLVIAAAMTITTINIYETLYQFPETYDNIFSYIAAFCVILISKLLYVAINKISCEKIKSCFFKSIEFTSKLFLPFYLSHVCVGLNTIFILRKYDINSSLCVFMAFAFSILGGVIIYKTTYSLKHFIKKIHGIARC